MVNPTCSWKTSVNSGGCDNSWERRTRGDSVILSSRETEKGYEK